MRSSDWSSDVCSSDLLADEIEVDDAAPVDALETARVEPFLQVLHRLAQDERIVAGIDEHIVAGGIDLLDRVDIDAEDLAPVLEDRKSVVEGKSVTGSVDLGDRRIMKKKKQIKN